MISTKQIYRTGGNVPDWLDLNIWLQARLRELWEDQDTDWGGGKQVWTGRKYFHMGIVRGIDNNLRNNPDSKRGLT